MHMKSKTTCFHCLYVTLSSQSENVLKDEEENSKYFGYKMGKLNKFIAFKFLILIIQIQDKINGYTPYLFCILIMKIYLFRITNQKQNKTKTKKIQSLLIK